MQILLRRATGPAFVLGFLALTLAAAPARDPADTPFSADPEPCRGVSDTLLDTLYSANLPDSLNLGLVTAGMLAEYAQARSGYDRNAELSHDSATYIRYGMSRAFAARRHATAEADTIVRVASLDDVPIYTRISSADSSAPVLIYLPIRPACEFQPYVNEARITL